MNRTTGTIGIVVGVCVGASIGVVRATAGDPRASVESIAPAAEAPQASQYVGMGGCATSTCHVGPKDWAEKRDGGAEKRQHINAINQLAAKTYPNVTKYVAAVGGKGAYSTRLCTDCHTTPKPGDDIEGVTCEKCHGAGSRYLKAHSEEKPPKRASAYTALGMRDFSQGPKWAKLCNDCHVLGNGADHQKLANAGHPTGADFDLGQKYAIVMGPPGASTHWNKSRYTTAQVAAFLPPRPAAPKPAAAAVETPPPAPATTPPPTPPAAPPANVPVPTPVVAVTPPASNPNPPAPLTASPPTSAPAGPVARTAPVTPPPVAPAPRPVETVVPPVPPPTVVAPPPVTRSPRTPAAPVTPAVQEPVAPAPAAGAEPRTVSSLLAAVQGRVITVLTAYLGQNVSVPQRVVPPAAAPRFTGPDAELLRLQQDVIALALELLSAPPVKPVAGGGGK